MATAITYVPDETFPTAAIYDATQTVSVVFRNPTPLDMFWTTEATAPTGDITLRPSVGPYETGSLTMVAGEALRICIPGVDVADFPQLILLVG